MIESRKLEWLLILCVFSLSFFIFWKGEAVYLADSVWAVHVSGSLLWDGDVALTEYEDAAEAFSYYAIYRDYNGTGELMPHFPVGVSLLSVPFLWLINQLFILGGNEPLYSFLLQNLPNAPLLLAIQKGIASVFTAAAGPFFYMAARRLYGRSTALLGAVTLLLATPLFSMASRALWQHAPTVLLLTIALYFLVRGKKDDRWVIGAAPFLAFAFFMRPTNALSAALITVYVLYAHRRRLIPFMLAAAVVSIPYFLFNFSQYSVWLQPYFTPGRIGISPHFWYGLAGNLISPNRGLFIWIPIMLFLPVSIFLSWRRRSLTMLDVILFLIIFLHILIISTNVSWWGGHSYGNRFIADVTPYLVFLLLPFYDALFTGLKNGRRASWLLAAPTVLLLLASIAIHARGAYQPWLWNWNHYPINIDIMERMWDWRDIMFLRTMDQYPVKTTYDVALTPATAENVQYLHLQNLSQEPYTFLLKAPPAITLLDTPLLKRTEDENGRLFFMGDQPLAPQQRIQIPFRLDLQSSDYVNKSWGAFQLTVTNSAQTNSVTQIIPISVHASDHVWQDNAAVSSNIYIPQDVAINGKQPGTDLFALFGTGFYMAENLGTARWRWARSSAELYLYSDRARMVTLQFAFSSLFPPLAAGESEPVEMTIAHDQSFWQYDVTTADTVSLPLQLHKGWNTVTITSAAGNFRPVDLDLSGDSRQLSFAISPILISSAEK